MLTALIFCTVAVGIIAIALRIGGDRSLDEQEQRLLDDAPEPDLAALHHESLVEYADHGGDVDDPDAWFEDEVSGSEAAAGADVADDDNDAAPEDDEAWFPRVDAGDMVMTQPFDIPDSFYAAEDWAAEDRDDEPAVVYSRGNEIQAQLVAGMLRANGIQAELTSRGLSMHVPVLDSVLVPAAQADVARQLIADVEAP